MRLTSPAFGNGEQMPWRYTAASLNERPPLQIADVPADANSLALVMEDIDSALGEHVTHWFVWNLPPDTEYIDAVTIPAESRTGTDSFGKMGYTGPMALEGRHHFRFRLIALDAWLDLPAGATRALFDDVIRGRVLDEAELIGYVEPGSMGDENNR